MNFAHSNPGRLALALGIGSLVLHSIAVRAAAAPVPEPSFANLPLYFEPNRGQADPSVKFVAQTRGCRLLLKADQVTLECVPLKTGPGEPQTGFSSVEKSVPNNSRPETIAGGVSNRRAIRMSLVGANSGASCQGEAELPGRVHYLLGNDPDGWLTDVPTFGAVRFREVYSGVDVIYYGNPRRFEHDFVIAPGTDPSVVQLEFDGVDGMDRDSNGDLVLRLGTRELRLRKPVVYQLGGGIRRPVEGSYQMSGSRTVGFEIGAYDARRELIIDPVLGYSTYIGAEAGDTAWDVKTDAGGNVYLTGSTLSTQMAVTPGVVQTNYGGATPPLSGDAFVAKFLADGSGFSYLTYLGGSGNDSAFSLALDDAGNVCLTGFTDSTNFPTKNALQTTVGGTPDPNLGVFLTSAFVTKLNAAGSGLIYSTYLGGDDLDTGYGVSMDSTGSAYVTGYTYSTNFPTRSAFQTNLMGGSDAFVSVISPEGTNLMYSTYLGGAGTDRGQAITASSGGAAWVAGVTTSPDFPLMNAFQTNLNTLTNASLAWDAFVVRIDPSSTNLEFSTYLGGVDDDFVLAVTGDETGGACLTGWSASSDFPVTTTNYSFGLSDGDPTTDAFLARFTPGSSFPDLSFLFGGNSEDKGRDVAVSPDGNIFVTGTTFSTDFPVAGTNGALRASSSGALDAFVTSFAADGSALRYSVYLGGRGNDAGNAIDVDAAGNAYVTGSTTSGDFPTNAAPQPLFAGGTSDAFLAKILADPRLRISASGNEGLLQWRAPAPDFSLESTTDLPPTGWTPVTGAPFLTNGFHSVVVELTNGRAFYRLAPP